MALHTLSDVAPPMLNFADEDEKSSTSLPSPSSTSPEPVFEYTEDEERKVRRKLNMIVLPLLFLGFYVFQLERGNIANALTDDFMPKVGITQDQFNTGQALLFVGIILGELPSQYVLQWIGPQVSGCLLVSRHHDYNEAKGVDLDLVPSPGLWSGGHFSSLSKQLCIIPHNAYPSRYHRVWVHSRVVIHRKLRLYGTSPVSD